MIDVLILTTGVLRSIGPRIGSAGHFGTASTGCCCRCPPHLCWLRRLAGSNDLMDDPRRERRDRMREIIRMAPHDVWFFIGSRRCRVQREVPGDSFLQFLQPHFEGDVWAGLGESLWPAQLKMRLRPIQSSVMVVDVVAFDEFLDDPIATWIVIK